MVDKLEPLTPETSVEKHYRENQEEFYKLSWELIRLLEFAEGVIISTEKLNEFKIRINTLAGIQGNG